MGAWTGVIHYDYQNNVSYMHMMKIVQAVEAAYTLDEHFSWLQKRVRGSVVNAAVVYVLTGSSCIVFGQWIVMWMSIDESLCYLRMSFTAP